jgi:Right handed beta helix region
MSYCNRSLVIGGLVGGLVLILMAPAAWAAPRHRTITVRTAGQLVGAIGSDRTIRVMPGTYNLTDAAGLVNRHVSWSKRYDGKQLDVSKVKNLKIVGVGRKRPRLLARPRYAWVIRFIASKNVTLDNLVLGHTVAGGCMGGVVAFERTKKAQILRSELFGSGTIGVELKRTSGFLMDRSVIRGCTYGILRIKRSPGARFKRSTFRDNKEYDLIEIQRSRNVRFEGCTVTKNRTGRNNGYALFKLDRTSNVILQDGAYHNNTIDLFVNRPKRLKVLGSAKLKQQIGRLINRPDPQYNQIYRVVRYRKWVVTATQAGIVFLDARTGKVALLKKAYISQSLLVLGKHLWVGTYRRVYRFDGLRSKSYTYSAKARGHHLVRGSKGEVYVRVRRGRLLRYDVRRDRLVRVKPTWQPPFTSFDLVLRPGGVVWAVKFFAWVGRYSNGQWSYYRRFGQQYTGSDPRRIYISGRGRVWVADFRTGFYLYNPGRDAFVRDSTVSNKGSAMAVDVKRKRTWLLHYTKGLYLKRAGKPVHYINLTRLRYMRDVHLENRTGTIWVGSDRGLVRIHRQGGAWKQQAFLVR